MKCKFRKKCKLYDPQSRACTKDGGNYYGVDLIPPEFIPAGCYVKMLKQEKQSKRLK